jgi:hypothetical protein
MAGSAATTHLFDRLFDTSGSVGFFRDHRAEFKEFTEAYVFFHDLDAIVAGFYEPGRAFTEGGGSADPRYRWSDVPHLVLRDHRGAELWLGGCNCGYRGTGPWGSRQVLIQAGFPAGLVDQLPHYRLLYLDRLAGTFTGQRPTTEEQQAEVFYPGCPDFDTKVRRIRWHDWLLLVDDAPVRLLEPAAPGELLEKWTVYAPLWMPNRPARCCIWMTRRRRPTATDHPTTIARSLDASASRTSIASSCGMPPDGRCGSPSPSGPAGGGCTTVA